MPPWRLPTAQLIRGGGGVPPHTPGLAVRVSSPMQGCLLIGEHALLIKDEEKRKRLKGGKTWINPR